MKFKKVGALNVAYNNDRYIRQVLQEREYKFLGYYPTVIDIGANIGTWSLSMLDYADKIYAIEPAQENIECLKETIEVNGINKIVPLQMAISYGSWVQMLEEVGTDAGEGGFKISENGTRTIDCRTLRDFMDSQEIEYADLVKIDIEGLEVKVFETPLFPCDRIGTIIGEYHFNEERVQELLEWMGYKYIHVDPNSFIARKI